MTRRTSPAPLLASALVLALGLGGLVAAAFLVGGAEVQDPVLTAGEAKSDGWRAVRTGGAGRISIPDARGAVLVQSEGDIWRSIRNGPVSVYGAWALLGTLVLLGAVYLIRGRIRVQGVPSGREVVRFGSLDRFAHWLTAVSFLVLALTGLNLLYGRYVLLPLIGKNAFAVITELGKIAHNYIAFSFMLGVMMMFVLWAHENLPRRTDLAWLRVGGGLLSDRHHPPAGKFNAGQKLVFWVVVLGGFSVSLSGVALLFPFSIRPFAETFAILHALGFNVPPSLTALQEMQLAQLWHTIVSLGLMVLILAHIYIGTLGMQGAFQAMGSGKVDAAWARQHHSEWAPDGEEPPEPAMASRVARPGQPG